MGKNENETHRDIPQITGYKHDREFAAMMKKNTKTTWPWRKEGLGPVFSQAGRDIFYAEKDITAWLESCCRPAGAPRSRRGRPRKVKAAA